MNELVVLSNPHGRRRRKHRARRRAATSRPRRRRARRAAVQVIHARRNPSRRRRRHHAYRVRRNPSRRRGMFRQSGAAMTSLLIPGAVGAAGALSFDVAWGKLSGYLPAALQGNYYVSAGLKLVAAFAVAKFGRKVVSPQTANAVAAGIAVVTLYDVGQILTGTLMAPAASTATPVSGLGKRLNGLGYVGTGMSVSPGAFQWSPFAGLGRRVGMDGLGDVIDGDDGAAAANGQY